ncbi:hypothetical protein C0J52_09114 [Blattella germanica]|nr:hypothetical protein C0J52_09114 [Blattella germanica]
MRSLHFVWSFPNLQSRFSIHLTRVLLIPTSGVGVDEPHLIYHVTERHHGQRVRETITDCNTWKGESDKQLLITFIVFLIKTVFLTTIVVCIQDGSDITTEILNTNSL